MCMRSDSSTAHKGCVERLGTNTMKDILVFVGSYNRPLVQGTGETVCGIGEGIYVMGLNSETGALTRLHAYPEIDNPTYLCTDAAGRYLYCVNELKESMGVPSSTVSAYEIDPQTKALAFLNKRHTGGTDACHLALNKSGTHLFVANYMSGSVCVFPIEERGAIGAPSCFLQHRGSSVDPKRQSGPHAHGITFDLEERRILVPDLGTDEIVLYDVDWAKGHLRAPQHPNPKTAPGEGPRHCVFHPGGRMVYLINELKSTVYVFSYAPQTGEMQCLQRIGTLPEGCSTPSSCAAIKIHPSGKFLYGSNRGHDSIAVYSIGDDGLLSPPAIVPSHGEIPRDFDISPDGRWMLAANQKSDNLVVYAIDPRSGVPEKRHIVGGINTATNVVTLQ